MKYNSNKKVETNQKIFFDKIYKRGETASILNIPQDDFLYFYAVEYIINGLTYVCKQSENTKRHIILDYGCGGGTWIDVLLKREMINKETHIVGVDISESAIDLCLKKFKNETNVQFCLIEENKIPSIEDFSIDGIYMLGILHHTENHKEIFTELCNKLKSGGRLYIFDLSSSNPIINFSRKLFTFMPLKIKNKFSDDLVIEGVIPEKLKVDPTETIKILKETGFTLFTITYHHLFVFVFIWCIQLMPWSKSLFSPIASFFYKIESLLLRFSIFQKISHVFCIKAFKK